ncbi:reverse transcriptase family protein [Burkholderia arboris]|uniref:reverse transcriptase family protein n=1 Tax=Burkholderia arboris TaxID=488730 RepID=UPI0015887497|nr:reverse transcriptase family protein [Burkholderia arboris]
MLDLRSPSISSSPPEIKNQVAKLVQRLGCARYVDCHSQFGTNEQRIFVQSFSVSAGWIGGNLADTVPYLDSTFGFVPSRSHIDAAAKHCKSDWVYSIDIKDFFRTTKAARVRDALIGIGYSGHAADLTVALTCYEGALAQGAPSSPVLSNIVFREFDCKLEEVAQEFGITFTRYADDIVFSGVGISSGGRP